MERQRQIDLNMASTTDAKGWASLFAALGGQTSTPPEPSDFLPYPLARSVTSDRGAYTAATSRNIERAIETGKIPEELAAIFKRSLTDVKRF